MKTWSDVEKNNIDVLLGRIENRDGWDPKFFACTLTKSNVMKSIHANGSLQVSYDLFEKVTLHSPVKSVYLVLFKYNPDNAMKTWVNKPLLGVARVDGVCEQKELKRKQRTPSKYFIQVKYLALSVCSGFCYKNAEEVVYDSACTILTHYDNCLKRNKGLPLIPDMFCK